MFVCKLVAADFVALLPHVCVNAGKIERLFKYLHEDKKKKNYCCVFIDIDIYMKDIAKHILVHIVFKICITMKESTATIAFSSKVYGDLSAAMALRSNGSRTELLVICQHLSGTGPQRGQRCYCSGFKYTIVYLIS